MTEKKKNVCLPKRLIASRKLIGNLAKNDFKKKFAGSYFGVIWAFIQPVITVLLYWFVFEFGLHQKVNDLRTGIEVPFYPDLYVLQVVYYSFCMVTFTAGLIYATSAVTVFFRDMKEVVAILLQIGMWVTPIMWNFESMQGIPKWAVVLLKLNPMYYIVSGYRDALINKTAFWEHPGLTLWFWGITLFTLWAGTTVFKRLRVHFADVL